MDELPKTTPVPFFRRYPACLSLDDFVTAMEVSMRTIRLLIVGPLVLVMGLSNSAFAQDRHAVDPSTLATAVAEHAAAQDADRAAVREALTRPEVRDVAAKAGIDLERVTATANTLTGPELQRAAAAARHVNQALVGGASTITLSTTTLIIILLVVILIIVAAK